MSEGDLLPGAKRIGGLKTGDCEGCLPPDEDFRRKKGLSLWRRENETEPELGLIRVLSPKVSCGMSTRELGE